MKRFLSKSVATIVAASSLLTAYAQELPDRAFEQLGTTLPTPNVYRDGSGAPGPNYWQQQVDYQMNIALDEEKRSISGDEVITYHNNSPQTLTYLWLQLDQNVRAKGSASQKIETVEIKDKLHPYYLKKIVPPEFDGGFNITSLTDAKGNTLPYVINETMMRVDLPAPLKPNGKYVLKIKWNFNINDRMLMGGRSGYEHFEEDGNDVFTIAQFFPRMCVYNDVEGWQHKQFLGQGEFALPFGNYNVNITVPADHIVGGTGEIKNLSSVLTAAQLNRYKQSKTAQKPLEIVTQAEAEDNEKEKASGTKTWTFQAENVRDFGFASSRKFIWDAMGVEIGNKTIMAMSLYPKEGNPLWGQYSTEAVAHTLKVYSKHTIDYPYPVAYSVHAKDIGMEYPMICFNFGRPEKDGTYSDRVKYGMLMVIIHEVGHNFFPMIVNSDERQWTWMDEGLNSFCQYLAEQEWDVNYPHRSGPAYKIIPYMSGDKADISPIMTSSENVKHLGPNAYSKPTTALNILREVVMGRELFDYAFKEYSRRWAFKHPTPADFFRTMEDASGVDLDWFWRGWFYSTDHVDIAINEVRWYKMDTKDPDKEVAKKKEESKKEKQHISQRLNNEAGLKTAIEENPELKDFYNSYDPYVVTEGAKKQYETFYSALSPYEKSVIDTDYNFYQVKFENIGGLVMPLLLAFTFEDGSKQSEYIPAEIWKTKNKEIVKVFPFKKKLVAITLDPERATADTDEWNNYWPVRNKSTRFEVFKQNYKAANPMQQQKK